MRRFEAAPWSRALNVVSIAGTIVLIGVAYALYRGVPRGTRAPFAESFGTAMLAVPFLIFLIAVLFVVGGYEVEGDALYVRRLLWRTRVGLEGLDRAWHDPAAMCRSVRVFGNGGLFAVTGVFRNATLGRYRAFVTDPRQAVVLHVPARTIVVSPAHPAAFLDHLRARHPGLVTEPPPVSGETA